MKRNLIIFPGNYLPYIGGLETHVDEFVKYLSKDDDYKITIFTPKVGIGFNVEKIHKNKVLVLRYPAIEIVPNFFMPQVWNPKFWCMFLKLYTKKYDIVMTRTRFFVNSTIGMFFAKFRLRRIKLIHVEHGSEYVELESKFKTFVAKVYDKIFGKMIFYLADKNVAISTAVYDFVRSEFIGKKKELPIIRRGVDFNLYKKIKKNVNLRNEHKNKIIITYLGRLYKWKGVANSIKAYKDLSEEVQKRVVFFIVGDGEDMERLETMAGGYLDNGIYFTGRVDFDDAISILKSTDIYLHSAYKGGGLSNSLLQAMYCSCSVVASPNEGASEVIGGNNGLLLDNNSVSSLRKGITKVVNNEKLRLQYAKNAKQFIEKKFSWEEVVKKYKKIFDEVMK